MPVPCSSGVTVAPGTTAPVASLTVPRTVDVSNWASARAGSSTAMENMTNRAESLRLRRRREANMCGPLYRRSKKQRWPMIHRLNGNPNVTFSRQTSNMNTLHDVRHAVRLLIRRPGFTVTAAATMAIAIAGNTIVFALIRGILLAPLPLPAPDRLVRIEEVHAAGPANVAGATFTDLRRGARTLAAVAALRIAPIAVSAKDQALQVTATTATDDYFGVLGLGPSAGRLPDGRDFVAGAEPVAVLSVDLARRLFGSERDAVGQAIRAGGAARSVAGVVEVPRSAPGSADLWLPHSSSSSLLANRRARLYTVIARLRPDASAETASEELEAIAANVLRHAPEAGAGMTLRATPLRDRIVQPVRASLLVLWGAVGVLLVIAFANVANLLLMDGSVRARELTLRSALGAPRSALVRQLATETALLGLAGGAAGALLGAWGVAVLRTALPASLPRVSDVRPDLSLILRGVALSIVASIAFGLVPAFRSSRRDAAAALRNRDRTRRRFAPARRPGRRRSRAHGRPALRRGIARPKPPRPLRRTPMGFEPRDVAAIDLSLPGARYPDSAAHARFYGDLLDRLAATPGIEGAGVTGALPLSATAATTMIPQHGHADQQPIADVITATPGVFRALQHSARARPPDRSSRIAPAGRRSPIVNETAARTMWPAGIDPIGASIEMRDWGAPVPRHGGWRRRGRPPGGRDRPARPAVYYPLAQFPQTTLVADDRVTQPRCRSNAPSPRPERRPRDRSGAADRHNLSMEARIDWRAGAAPLQPVLLGAFARPRWRWRPSAFTESSRSRSRPGVVEIAIRIALGAPPAAIVRAGGDGAASARRRRHDRRRGGVLGRGGGDADAVVRRPPRDSSRCSPRPVSSSSRDLPPSPARRCAPCASTRLLLSDRHELILRPQQEMPVASLQLPVSSSG